MKSKIFPTLYGTGSTGRTKLINIRVDERAKDVLITMEHGLEGKKQAVNHREITVGLNIGKKNETTPFDQAVSDAQSKWNKKKDEGYTETKKAQKTQKLLLPMLALKYIERKHDIKFPCYVQPKFNGVRCIYTDHTFNSRGGKPFTTLDQFDEECSIFEAEVQSPLDGEVYCHNEISFQDIVAAVKKTREPFRLKYYIYDLANEGLPFETRTRLIKEFFDKMENPQYLVRVPTYEVKNEAEIIKYHEQFVQDGYEGIMIRNKEGEYEFKHRSKNLQKWKNFDDDEFEIIGGKEATGNDKGTIVFQLITKEGKEFEARPKGSRQQRKEWFQNLQELVGKKAIIRFQQKTNEGIPRFPVLIEIRDYE